MAEVSGVNIPKKKSYKNILLTPAPVVNIISFTSYGFEMPSSKRFLLESIEQSLDVPTSYSQLEFIMEEEEKELQALNNSSSLSYKKLYRTLYEVAKRMRVNILAVIGHVEICTNELKRLNFLSVPPNGLPNIVILIACHSKQYMADFSRNPKYHALKYYFFGFENLMHVIDGEIYECELPYNDTPYLECRYEGAIDDLYKLYDYDTRTYKGIDDETITPESNKLALCINARFYRYVKSYKEGLYKRNCSKFGAEEIINKLKKSIQTADGQFIDPSLIDGGALTFLLEDGLHCTRETCPIKVDTKWDELNRVFDQETLYIDSVREIKRLMNYENPSKEETDNKFVSYLNRLPVASANKVLSMSIFINYAFDKVPIFFIPFLYNMRISMKEIFTKYTIEYSGTFHEKGLLHVLFNNITVYRYSLKEKFRICLQIKDTFQGTNPFLQYDVFEDPTDSGHAPFMDLLHKYKENIPLIYFYFKFFPGLRSSKSMKIDYNTLVIEGGTPLLNIFFNHESEFATEFGSEFVSLLEKLLINGVNPSDWMRDDSDNPIQYYEQNAPELINPVIPFLLTSYSITYTVRPQVFSSYLEDRVSFYKNVQENKDGEGERLKNTYITKLTKLQNEIKKLTKDLIVRYRPLNIQFIFTKNKEYIELKKKETMIAYRIDNFDAFVQSAKEAFEQAAAITKDTVVQQSPEDIEPEIDFALAPYIEGARAIPSVKDLYTSIQKYVKKSKGKYEEKAEFLKKIGQLYQSKASRNENEGNSAFRRLQLIQTEFDAFKAKNKPSLGGFSTRRNSLYRKHRQTRKH